MHMPHKRSQQDNSPSIFNVISYSRLRIKLRPLVQIATASSFLRKSSAVGRHVVMMRASDRNQRLKSCAHTAVPAQMEPVCRLSSLPPALLGVLWPAERVVMGMRVCKQLRRDLI
eukprot:358046-Rhodomonas_salina.1